MTNKKKNSNLYEYNVKGYKEIKFEEHKNPLDGFVITGYYK